MDEKYPRARVPKFDLPKELKLDDWFRPNVGELCISSSGKIGIVEKMWRSRPRNEYFKSSLNIKMVGDEYPYIHEYQVCTIYRLQVKRGKTFEFNGNIYKPQKALCGNSYSELLSGYKVLDHPAVKLKKP